MQIIYFADDSRLGDLNETECKHFRKWVWEELEKRFPNHDISVVDEQAWEICYTDDTENEDEIIDFCKRLWDNCPWDFV